jgi:hypothetical protein
LGSLKLEVRHGDAGPVLFGLIRTVFDAVLVADKIKFLEDSLKRNNSRLILLFRIAAAVSS